MNIDKQRLQCLVEHYCQCCDDPEGEWLEPCELDCWVWILRKQAHIRDKEAP